MVDAIVATGATIVDMDFFEALGFKHYQGTPLCQRPRAARELRRQDIRHLHRRGRAPGLRQGHRTDRRFPEPRALFLARIHPGDGQVADENAKKKDSLVQPAYENDVPIFCPAFSDSCAGFGLVLHQHNHPDKHVSIDSVKDFYELTKIKMAPPTSGLLMIGGGVPKNFAQDTVVCAEMLGKEVPNAQIRRADHRRRRARRRLLQLDAEGSLLMGQGRHATSRWSTPRRRLCSRS